ncbi:MAG: hypothetical protein AAF368_09435, partial [Planctomycetota bacterium]
LDTIGRSRDDEQQRGARFALPVGRRGLLGLTLGDRRSRASREGYFPGASGRSTAAGEGGTPRRGPGSEDLISPGEAAAFEAREDLTVRWQQQLGGAELRFGGGRSRAALARHRGSSSATSGRPSREDCSFRESDTAAPDGE